MFTLLVTGGAGYIGSHVVRALVESGHRTVVVDNLSKGHREAVLGGELVTGDLADEGFLDDLFQGHRFDGVMHFASHCYVGESVENPRLYFEENLGNLLILLRVMLRHGVGRFILSSTCATYGNPCYVPIDEGHPQQPINPYGESKLFIERILSRYDTAYGMKFVTLRYFNAAGASLDARLGESHSPEPHLVPILLRAAHRQQEGFRVYGNDYPTFDGTCVRDFIHVLDLAAAHIRAFERLMEGKPSDVFNLGTGYGYSVRQVWEAAQQVSGRRIAVETAARRPGDPPELVADARKAAAELGWVPQHSDLETILKTAWNWELNRRY